MQLTLQIGIRTDLDYILERLRPAFPALQPFPVLDPMAQLVKSLISSRTKDEVSWPSFWKLVELIELAAYGAGARRPNRVGDCRGKICKGQGGKPSAHLAHVGNGTP